MNGYRFVSCFFVFFMPFCTVADLLGHMMDYLPSVGQFLQLIIAFLFFSFLSSAAVSRIISCGPIYGVWNVMLVNAI